MAGGWAINLLQIIWEWPYIPACRVIFFAYAVIGALKLLLSIALSSAVEAEEKKKKPSTRSQQISEGETRPLLADGASNTASPDQRPPKKSLLSFVGDAELVSLVIRLAILFGLDSFASGLASLYVPPLERAAACFLQPDREIWYVDTDTRDRSWMTYFFKRKFSLPEGTLGSVFFTTSLISAASVLVASSIAKRIGNVKVCFLSNQHSGPHHTSRADFNRRWSSLISRLPCVWHLFLSLRLSP